VRRARSSRSVFVILIGAAKMLIGPGMWGVRQDGLGEWGPRVGAGSPDGDDHAVPFRLKQHLARIGFRSSRPVAPEKIRERWPAFLALFEPAPHSPVVDVMLLWNLELRGA
jgi:hypothetical protein